MPFYFVTKLLLLPSPLLYFKRAFRSTLLLKDDMNYNIFFKVIVFKTNCEETTFFKIFQKNSKLPAAKLKDKVTCDSREAQQRSLKIEQNSQSYY